MKIEEVKEIEEKFAFLRKRGLRYMATDTLFAMIWGERISMSPEKYVAEGNQKAMAQILFGRLSRARCASE